jgi:hypothetical protein
MEPRGDEKPKSGGAIGHRPAKSVIDKRIDAIGAWLIQGHRTQTIQALVLEAAKIEAERRQKANETVPPAAAPPFVWGDVVPPVSTKTVEVYIRRARERFELTGRELPKKAVEVLGLTYEMLHDLYWRALADKRYTVCRQLIRDQMEMFGLVGAIKVQLVGNDQPTGAAEPDTSHLPETEHTAEQLAAEWSKLLQAGLARVRANPGQRFLPPPGMAGPVSVTEAPAAERDEEPDEHEPVDNEDADE